MILEGGTIHTGDPALPTVRALPIDGLGRVARGVEAWEGDSSAVSDERIDLDGRTVVPGFVDAHLHFLSWALARDRVDVRDAPGGAAALELVRARAADDRAAGRDGDWLIGAGWTEAHLRDVADPGAALDEATGGRPAALWSRDHHALWLGDAAARALGLATAIAREDDAWRVALPGPSRTERQRAVVAAQRAAHALGLTAVHDFERRLGRRTWQELDVDERVTLRVTASLPADDLDAIARVEPVAGFGSGHVRIGPVKAFLDGTLGARTAWTLEPFDDAPAGEALLAGDDLRELIAAAAELGLPVAMHAIGDAAVREALDALEATRDAWSRIADEQPPRIEHAQLVHPADVARFGALGVVASMQPVHALEDRDDALAAWSGRLDGAYAWGPLHAAGATLVLGSDAPISPPSPLATLAAAVGSPIAPGHALAPADALRALTDAPHRISGLGRVAGRLSPGRQADLVVLEGDPLAVPADEIASIPVAATMVGGRWVHGRPPW